LSLRGTLEAILLVADEPVPLSRLAEGIGAEEAAVEAELRAMARELAERGSGIAIREIAGGWRFYTAPEYAEAVAAYLVEGQSARLSQAALETLAVIAYRQPVSRARIAAVRGVNVDGVVRTLVMRGLIDECGTEPSSGAVLYETTPLFLEKVGLTTLEELPPLAPLLPDIETLDDAHD
ncbi:MAG TPA: SMC-Scp complex subunit ScpB, partial [Mycobacteriales bacterium]|nr:SMC-Scp complex subunit ScpB [Mycobacteriales bacterium]